MKVFDVLTESEQTNEGPVRFLKRTLGKNTAMGKKAQVSAEIDAEAKRMYKDLIADIGNYNDPRMTVNNLAKWAQGAGFISNRSEIIKALRANPTFANRVQGAAKATTKAVKKGANAVADKATAAKKSIGNAYTKVKKAVTPEPSNFEKQPKLPGIESMYAEARFIAEVEQKGMNIELSKGEVFNVLRGLVKKGRQAGISTGKYTQQSSYGDQKYAKDASKKSGGKSSEVASDDGNTMFSPAVVAVFKDLKKQGYSLTKDGKPVAWPK